jgi:hypothetical protein
VGGLFLQTMAAWSPTLEGFRTIVRRPVVSLAEIAWRWSFGAAAVALFAFALLEYLDALPVSNLDGMLLRSRYPTLVLKSLAHIVRGSGLRVVLALLVLLLALTVLWVVVASIGRGVTLDAVVDHIHERAASMDGKLSIWERGITEVTPDVVANAGGFAPVSWRFRSLTGLHLLRAALALAACAGGLGAFFLGTFVSTDAHLRPGVVLLLSLVSLFIVWLVWSSLSWFLSLAAVFVVRQGRDTFDALEAAVEVFRDRAGPFIAVGTWFGLTHLVVFIVATSVVTLPLAFAQTIPIGYVLVALLVLTLAYFAIVDSLYIGRLAGYVAILEAPLLSMAAANQDAAHDGESSQQSALSIQPQANTVDQDELILSDVPPPETKH